MVKPADIDLRTYEDLRKRLVDLTRRNRLLQFRHSGRAGIIRIVDENYDRVIDQLRNGTRFRFKSLPDPEGEPADERSGKFQAALAAARILDEEYKAAIATLDPEDPAAAGKEIRIERDLRDRVRTQLNMPPRPRRRGIDLLAFAREHGVEPEFELATPRTPLPPKHTDTWLQTLLFPDQLKSKTTVIARNSRSIELETGVSTLHLAVGFLEWFESDSSDEAFLSPLLLMPTALERFRPRGGQDEFRLIALDDVPVTNLSLELRLLQDFRLRLPPYDPDEESSVEKYLAAVSKVVRRFSRWKIRRYLTLGIFSFARIAMYRDLDPIHWKAGGGPTAYPLVGPILRGGTTGFASRFADEYDIDKPEMEKIAPILVHDADSSQHSALIDAMQGRTIVIEGPPGTGKSQTISNLIANELHRGGTVLFVSEKMAALDVVKSRLDAVGLGDFCLTLHATGAKPSAVIEALRIRDAMQPPKSPIASYVDAKIIMSRSVLNSYLATFHEEIGSFGESAHDLIGRLTDLERSFPDLPVVRLRERRADLPAILEGTAVLEARRKLSLLHASSAIAENPDWYPGLSVFRGLDRSDLFGDEQDELFGALQQLREISTGLEDAVKELSSLAGQPDIHTPSQLQDVILTIDGLPDPDDEVDPKLLARLREDILVNEARLIAQDIRRSREAAKILQAAGIADPVAANADILNALAELARRAGLERYRVGDVPRLVEVANEYASQVEQQAGAVTAIGKAFDLGSDPELGSLRLACSVIELVQQADPAWAAHRRPGLERHRTLLEDAAERNETIRAKLVEVEALIDVSGISARALSNAAAVLNNPGTFAIFRGEFRDARRLFIQRWRGGPRPHRSQWARLLESAASALSDLDALKSDPDLRRVLGECEDPSILPLELIASAARWQCQLHEALSEAQLEVSHIASLVVTLDASQFHRIASLAAVARALSAFIDQTRVAADRPLSALRQAANATVDALAEISSLIPDTGLDPGIHLSELTAVGAATKDWQTATVKLASDRAVQLLADISVSPEVVESTCNFAAAVLETLPSSAAGLLSDGWTVNIRSLRGVTKTVSAGVNQITELLEHLRPLGLGNFASEVPSQTLPTIAAAAQRLLQAKEELPAYLRFASARAACVADPIAAVVVSAFDDTSSPIPNPEEALDWLVAWVLVRRHAEANRREFGRSGKELSSLRESFADADRRRLKSDAHQTALAALSRQIPQGANVGSRKTWTDGALLQNEFGKQQRFIPVRDLLARAGDAVIALTPCLMMSPLTVAQYLKPGKTFDLVIMDEASQIKPEDAIGALLRGRRAAIVGDPKQLPPTNFFDRSLDDDPASEAEEEGDTLSSEDRISAESILDVASQAFRPIRRLRWHYRSRHQDLIKFSNREFYNDNPLVVFPAAQPISETLGVELVQVDGRWKDRINIEEAKIVADAVAEFMRRHNRLSYGVVTMNQPQRELIEAEIELRAASDAKIATYRERWDDQLEPPFVKNLENVQGDERDVIFISLGWGRTPEGAMHQRFFPINRHEDGHRRLNVLFTRAKRKVVLFSSLRPEDIVVDPERTARGVQVLRDYLLYARDGQLAAEMSDSGEADNPFELSVANALRAHGHRVVPQLGVAGYQIDIVVEHPEMRSRYVLGIECDGATYHSARSARDRDRLRQEALERLGWRLTRVWSTDWFNDQRGQTKRLCIEIEEAIRSINILEDQKKRLVSLDTAIETVGRVIKEERYPRGRASPAPQPEPPIIRQDLFSHEREWSPPTKLDDLLRRFRLEVIMRDLPDSDPDRCILRDEMIDAIVKSKLDDPDEFREKIPLFLRSGTDGRQMRYLRQICEIVSDHAA